MPESCSLELSLNDLRQHRRSLLESGDAIRNASSQTEFYDLSNEILFVERKLAQITGAEYAEQMPWSVRWTTSSNFAVYFSKNFKGYFAYDHLQGVPTENSTRIALVEMPYCYSIRCGGPNDEAIEGHPLSGHGLALCEASYVVKSSWLAAQEKINQVHPQYNPVHWQHFKHMVWSFHDGQIEAIAKTAHVTIQEGTLETVIQQLIRGSGKVSSAS